MRWRRPRPRRSARAGIGAYVDRGMAPGGDASPVGHNALVDHDSVPPLRLGQRVFGPGELAVMAIVNRTPDSFFDKGATFAADAALAAVDRAVDEGADIIDIGGVKAGPGDPVDAAEELRGNIPPIPPAGGRLSDVVGGRAIPARGGARPARGPRVAGAGGLGPPPPTLPAVPGRFPVVGGVVRRNS